MTCPDFLYSLLPAVYRRRDLDYGQPLRALTAVLQQQYDALHGDMAALYDDWFVETCEDWLLPYLGDLVGAGELARRNHPAADLRSLVANTIAYRRRKGRADALEQVVADCTGWPARVAEFARLTARTANFRHLREDAGRTVSMRQRLDLDRLDGAFDTEPHRFAAAGPYRLDRVGVFVWRMRSYPVWGVDAARLAANRFTLHPLGRDQHLFTRVQTRPQLGQRVTELDVPAALRRDRPDLVAASVAVTADGQPVPPEQIVLADLSRWHRPHAPDTARMALDPVTGRLLMLRRGDAPKAVTSDHCYGFAADLGAGPYPRPSGPAQASAQRAADLNDALAQWQSQSDRGVIELVHSGTQSPRQGDAFAIALGGVHGGELVVAAAPQQRPCLAGGIDASAAASGCRLVLEGLLIGGPIRLHGPIDLILRDCTVDTGGQPSVWAAAGEGDGARVLIGNSIVGPVRLPSEAADLRLADSVVDGHGHMAVAGPDAGHGHRPATGPALTAERATLIGASHVARLDAADCLFTDTVTVAERHDGYVRHCWLPPASKTPPRFHCQPETAMAEAADADGRAEAERRVRPRFTSLAAGHPGYAQFVPACPPEIRGGAADGAEMGALNRLGELHREANLALALSEYLPNGLTATVIHADRHDDQDEGRS